MDHWSVYTLEVTLQTDMHIGHSPLGFVSRTLSYVPAHIPWYALALTLVKELGLEKKAASFARTEAFLGGCLRFTPLYIVHQGKLLWPWEEMNEIERKYLYSKYGVALDYSCRSAEENRLFEKEVILAKGRQEMRNTQLRGYIFARPGQVQGLELDQKLQIQEAQLTELILGSTWGGEISKGLGTLADVKLKPSSEVFGCTQLDTHRTEPVLNWPGGKSAPFFLEHSSEKLHIHNSPIRPVCGRRFHPDHGPGLRFEQPFLARLPGWQCPHDLPIGLGVKAARFMDG